MTPSPRRPMAPPSTPPVSQPTPPASRSDRASRPVKAPWPFVAILTSGVALAALLAAASPALPAGSSVVAVAAVLLSSACGWGLARRLTPMLNPKPSPPPAQLPAESALRLKLASLLSAMTGPGSAPGPGPWAVLHQHHSHPPHALDHREPPGKPDPEPIPQEPLPALLDRLEAAIQGRLVRLLETRAMLRAIIEGVDAPVFAIDPAGLVVLCNRAGERLMHRRATGLLGAPLEDVFSSSRLLSLAEKAQRGTAVREDIELSFDEKPRTFEVAALPARTAIEDLPARGPHRAGVVLTLRDVTDIVQTVRLKTDFVANASHELRTPIASIRAAVETMRTCPDDDRPMRARLISMTEQAVLRLEEMVADLLDLSALETATQPPARRPLPFSEVADALQALFETTRRERNVALAFEAAPELERLETDPKLIYLILRNLVDNAIKFAHPGTTVRVVAVPADIRHKPLDAEGQPPHDRPPPPALTALTGMRIAVIDRGEGIPLKHQARIFERFYQVDPSRQRTNARRGTGLGLSIVKHATRRLGGDIHVASVYGEGTTMTVELPDCVRIDDSLPPDSI